MKTSRTVWKFPLRSCFQFKSDHIEREDLRGQVRLRAAHGSCGHICIQLRCGGNGLSSRAAPRNSSERPGERDQPVGPGGGGGAGAGGGRGRAAEGLRDPPRRRRRPELV